MAAVVSESFDGVSAEELATSGLLPKIVKAAEGYYDATLAADGIVGDRESSVNQKILQKRQRNIPIVLQKEMAEILDILAEEKW